jgi:hypothetical protein
MSYLVAAVPHNVCQADLAVGKARDLILVIFGDGHPVPCQELQRLHNMNINNEYLGSCTTGALAKGRGEGRKVAVPYISACPPSPSSSAASCATWTRAWLDAPTREGRDVRFHPSHQSVIHLLPHTVEQNREIGRSFLRLRHNSASRDWGEVMSVTSLVTREEGIRVPSPRGQGPNKTTKFAAHEGVGGTGGKDNGSVDVGGRG